MTMTMPGAPEATHDLSPYRSGVGTLHGFRLFELTEPELRSLARRAAEGDVAQLELAAANRVITSAVRANLAATNVLDAANGMYAALEESPLESPLNAEYLATTSLSDWVLVGSAA